MSRWGRLNTATAMAAPLSFASEPMFELEETIVCTNSYVGGAPPPPSMHFGSSTLSFTTSASGASSAAASMAALLNSLGAGGSATWSCWVGGIPLLP